MGGSERNETRRRREKEFLHVPTGSNNTALTVCTVTSEVCLVDRIICISVSDDGVNTTPSPAWCRTWDALFPSEEN